MLSFIGLTKACLSGPNDAHRLKDEEIQTDVGHMGWRGLIRDWVRLATLLIGLLCAAIPTLAHGQRATATERYALQERCGKQASAYFDKEYTAKAGQEGSAQIMDFENHYSAKLNKCFFLEVLTFIKAGKMNKSFRLFDLNENKQYGVYFSTDGRMFDCEAGEVICSNEKEWRQAMKPYLED